jgi:glutamyl-tRNA synthetase
MIRVRFAPSPTGYLHVGGVRTALYNWLLARQKGGTFLLRIEDTDRSRFVEDAEKDILDNLAWCGLNPDEGVGAGGDRGPYRQSERLHIYRDHARRLVDQGHAYRCFCTPERLEAMRREQERAGLATMYDRTCRALDPAQARRRAEAGEAHVVRMVVPDGETVVVEDLIRGPVAFHTSQVDDQVLLKSDGFPTYHLAAVVDDHLMEITHVIRGEEWLSSTPKHLLLYRYFGWEPPAFAHLPLILNKQGKKLSKRDGDVSASAYRQQGYLPEGLLNFLALLGWSPGDDREFFTLDDLVRSFSLERVNKAGAVFDFDKLRHIQALHMRALGPEEVARRALPFFAASGLPTPPLEYVARVAAVMGERAVLLTDLVSGAPYFYLDPTEYDAKTVQKRWKAHTPELLGAWTEELAALPAWTAAILEESCRRFAEKRGVGAGELIHPARLCLSGLGVGPGLFEMMEVLGRETCLRRLRRGLEVLSSA